MTLQSHGGVEATQTRTPLYNGDMLLLSTQSIPQYLSPVENLDAPYSHTPFSLKEASDAVRLVSECNLPRDILTAAKYKLFGVYQDLVHQNPVTHLDGGIEEDDKWQKRQKKYFFNPPNTMRYHLAGPGIGF